MVRGLPWVAETASSVPPNASIFKVPGSNIVLDLHGDPMRAAITVFSDGNHHMALEEALAGFLSTYPEAGDIFYATTPPRILIEAMQRGAVNLGNLTLQVAPHIFISPTDVIDTLMAQGSLSRRAPYKRSRGNALLVRKDNPKKITGLKDLLRGDIKLAISNPTTEAASFGVYRDTLLGLTRLAGGDVKAIERALDDPTVVHSQLVHHREIPEIVAEGRADVTVIYYHLALRYTRIFPDIFDIVPLAPLSGEPGATSANLTTRYDIGLVGDGGPWGKRLFDFLSRDPAVDRIYIRHGLAAA